MAAVEPGYRAAMIQASRHGGGVAGHVVRPAFPLRVYRDRRGAPLDVDRGCKRVAVGRARVRGARDAVRGAREPETSVIGDRGSRFVIRDPEGDQWREAVVIVVLAYRGGCEPRAATRKGLCHIFWELVTRNISSVTRAQP